MYVLYVCMVNGRLPHSNGFINKFFVMFIFTSFIELFGIFYLKRK